MDAKLPPEARPGAVTLRVRDLERALSFYEAALGMRVLARDASGATLGADAPIVRLVEAMDAPRRSAWSPGLYHVAILLPSRAQLARILEHFSAFRVPLQGAADHLVSEALYLSDPEGNGIEIYADRERAKWAWSEDGAIEMATRVLDIEDLLAEAGPTEWQGMPDGTRVGHVHLQVADARAAETFYRDVVGFDLTARYGEDATFLSAGRYHHHVAANQWSSRGASPAPEGALGLVEWTLVLPTRADVEALAKRAGVEAAEDGARVRDPSGNLMRAVA